MVNVASSESFTSVHDEAVQLSHGNLMAGFVKVFDSEDNVYVEDADYTIDYDDGTVTVLSTGDMADATEYSVNYVWTPAGYCSQSQAELWLQQYEQGKAEAIASQFGDAMTRFITIADRAIDSELDAPEGFFADGGLTLAEVYDSADLGVVDSWVSNPFLQYGRQPLLRLKHTPILSVTSVVETRSDGSTRTLTVNTDYRVEAKGIRFLTNFPEYGYANLTVTYTAGYAATPSQVSNVSAQLAAALAASAVASKLNLKKLSDNFIEKRHLPILDSCFSAELKAEISRYRLITQAQTV